MYKKIEPKLENTVFEVRTDGSGREISYRISPAQGYKLHEVTLDEEVMNEGDFEPTGEIKPGFTKSYVTAGAGYDFEKNERQIYAVKEAKEE